MDAIETTDFRQLQIFNFFHRFNWFRFLYFKQCDKHPYQNSYNFNTHDMLSPTPILDAYNIRGLAEETLPLLAEEVADLQRKSRSRRTSTRLRQREICAK